ncbi:MAG: hypothetical protein ACJ741_07535 [Pyrinomonadaceae bacterium]
MGHDDFFFVGVEAAEALDELARGSWQRSRMTLSGKDRTGDRLNIVRLLFKVRFLVEDGDCEARCSWYAALQTSHGEAPAQRRLNRPVD